MKSWAFWCLVGIGFGLVATVLLALWVEPTTRHALAVVCLAVGTGWYGFGLGLRDRR